MNKERVRNGIKAYHHEQQVLLRLIRKHGTLSANHFDTIFYQRGMFMSGRRRKLHGFCIAGDSVLLGGMSGPDTRDWWLDLLQHMLAVDLVDTDRVDGEIVYKLP